ncbi:MAG: permease-like cell division protein FtsX [Candidatus Nealsonbacteria bacterium]
MASIFKRIVKSGWLGFKRNSGLSLATIFIMILTISLVTSLYLSSKASEFLVASLTEKVDMSVYFAQEPSSEDIVAIQEELSALPEVKALEYVSKDEALEKFTTRHQGEDVIIESLAEVGGNPLLASLNIVAFKADQYSSISSFIDQSSFRPLIEKIDYYDKKPAIDRLLSLTGSINTFGVVLSSLLALVAILIAFNTVRIAIHNSKDEIETMRLVGASNWFIRGPFLVQGTINGLLAVLVTFLLFSLAVWFLEPKIEILMPDFKLASFFFSHFLIIISLQLLAGVGLGVCASFLAVRRYLKV